jgi:hypothetical protein
VLPKFIVRSQIEFFLGKISIQEYLHRIGDFFTNKWNGVDEVMDFHDSKNIKSSFFVGVNNGVGLSYSLPQSAAIIQRIVSRGFDAGVHGICFDSYDGIKREYDLFKQFSGFDSFGIRMHYLRQNEHTLNYLSQAGYAFDSTVAKNKNPYLINGMFEFPMHLMDSWLFENGKKWQDFSTEQAKEKTLRAVEKAQIENLSVMNILFHDHYFSKSFASWMNWYIWLVEWLVQNKFEVITFKEFTQ